MIARNLLTVSTTLALSVPAQAVVLYHSPTRNTTAPAGTLSSSGWQYQGKIGQFLGTPISPKHFAIAAHTGVNVGNILQYNSVNYTVDGIYTIPDTDIRICRVSGTFSTFAPLYNEETDDELPGKLVMVFGRGTQRGEEVHLDTAPHPGESTLRGWKMGPIDGVQSWGTNVIEGFGVDDTGDEKEYVYFNFSDNGTDNEGMVSDKDSGGGMFAQGAGGVWKLVGVHTGLDYLAFKLNSSDATEFLASVFDRGGLYVPDYDEDPPYPYILEPDTVEDIPQNGFSSNLSNFLDVLEPFIPIPGDADFNGKVNTLDFNTFAANYGSGGLWAQGDFNWDGQINSLDFNLIVENFGRVAPPSPIAGSLPEGALAPEPSMFYLLAVPLLFLRQRFADKLTRAATRIE